MQINPKNNIQKPRGIREFRGSSYNQRFKINNDIYKEGFLKNFDSKKLYLGPTLCANDNFTRITEPE